MISRPPRLYLDANIVIYLLEGSDEHAQDVNVLASAIDDGDVFICTSMLTLAEALVAPLRANDRERIDAINKVFAKSPLVTVLPIDEGIVRSSAALRATFGGTLPDAVHVASALSASCSHLVTEDQRIKVPKDLELSRLSTCARMLDELRQTSIRP